eukprot:354062-Chlamydomonas_euryale.AAC.1
MQDGGGIIPRGMGPGPELHRTERLPGMPAWVQHSCAEITGQRSQCRYRSVEITVQITVQHSCAEITVQISQCRSNSERAQTEVHPCGHLGSGGG